jgi:membrane-associated phospholipid phosphatase
MLQLNLLIIFYVTITSLIMVISKVPHKRKNACYLLNSFILVWEVIPFLIPVHIFPLRILFDWSPLLFLPLLHQQTGLLTLIFQAGLWDQKFIDFDNKYFPYVMSFHIHNRGNSLFISEILHLCYFSFYALIYGVPLYFYLKQEYVQYYQTVFVILALLFSCYLTHWLIPIHGPRNIFAKINDARSRGIFFRLVHKVLEKGSTAGTAFPSGHTGTAAVAILITWYWQSPIFYFVLPFGLGLILSTLYGRFHYVTDVIVGLVYAFMIFIFTLWTYKTQYFTITI